MGDYKLNICKYSDELYDMLPQNIKDSDILTLNDKKTLSVICFYRIRFSNEALENDGWYYLSSRILRNSVGISTTSLVISLERLEAVGLIERKYGQKYEKGQTPQATRYRILPQNFKKVLKKPSFEDLILASSNSLEINSGDKDKLSKDKLSKEEISKDNLSKVEIRKEEIKKDKVNKDNLIEVEIKEGKDNNKNFPISLKDLIVEKFENPSLINTKEDSTFDINLKSFKELQNEALPSYVDSWKS